MKASDLQVERVYRLRPGKKSVMLYPLKKVIRYNPDAHAPGGRVVFRALRPDGSLGSEDRASGDYFAAHVVEGPLS